MFIDWEEDYIWLAGFIDGEGCFSIAKVKRKWLDRYVYQGQLLWTSIDIWLLEEMKEWLGGSLTYYKGSTTRGKPYAVHAIYQRLAESIIKRVLPYLRLKKPQAELFLQYMTKVRLKGAQAYRGRTEKDWDELEQIYLTMKKLNQRGI